MKSLSEMIAASKEFSQSANNVAISAEEATTGLVPLGQILIGVATVVLLCVGAILGVKYMAADTNKRAEVKERLIWYVVSVVLIYGAIGIYTLISTILNGLVN